MSDTSSLRKGAELSPDGKYRWLLTRSWEGHISAGAGIVNFVMLNPSTADAHQDDATIRRCIVFAKDWGYTGLTVTNLYALRARNPKRLWEDPDPVGSIADDVLMREAKRADLVVCAWGVHGLKHGRGKLVFDALVAADRVAVAVLGWVGSGAPRHPLYAPGGLQPLMVSHGF